ncbi:hypothetical protein [Streptomyces sp. GESEQ-35]|uniref:hypothetical protein n=1 Tax=Streptomyces sp. GESEQ-35 TaxID=2812657 RepID=UPI001FF269A6|nr:hypothetical protein [Streptomyces sp. GESEQ-35]
MDDAVVTALIAAGAAIGGALTGVFTFSAAAWDVGQLQATAQLDVARRTLTEQTLANQWAVR